MQRGALHQSGRWVGHGVHMCWLFSRRRPVDVSHLRFRGLFWLHVGGLQRWLPLVREPRRVLSLHCGCLRNDVLLGLRCRRHRRMYVWNVQRGLQLVRGQGGLLREHICEPRSVDQLLQSGCIPSAAGGTTVSELSAQSRAFGWAGDCLVRCPMDGGEFEVTGFAPATCVHLLAATRCRESDLRGGCCGSRYGMHERSTAQCYGVLRG